MKHVRVLNQKRLRVEKLGTGEEPVVEGFQSPAGCATVFDPGWEADSTGLGVAGLCQPVERDLYGCYADCWWPAQVPDGMTNFRDWHRACPAAQRDWQKITVAE
ncbi:quinohemoprotein amine dehydrogenase subunit gamma [Heliobacterium gestii]|uniref:Quinohemoprotein amine dehydrogenase subunit gamma n=1 Tax=Heliomicrobium gestii TaxID=2699 RepID=A0A845LEV2_HELGE|nr:quinohemoprotein amine dehydrogenase subunit gamma [Heliomicrobium gestii]MBM7866229.1 hypothetical protein [Heliomicrobium gestii]MZP42975.1 quinohemoprotein amine dehydrogenase subunit gamma [Heliomicrobium gestii]